MPYLRTETQMSAYTHTPDQKNSASVSDDCGNLCSLHLQPHVELCLYHWISLQCLTAAALCLVGSLHLQKHLTYKSIAILYIIQL